MINERTVPTEWYDHEAKKADRYWAQYREASHLAAMLTGYMSGLSKWDTEIPIRARIKMLELLIEQYEPLQEKNEAYSQWVEEWKKVKEELEK